MNRYSLFLIPALLLAGCATPPATSGGATPEAPPPQIGEETFVIPETKPVMSGNRAVIALLDRARLDSEAGKRESAGASLERALRIEPRNAWLWHELAQLRLAQGQYAQAITLAQKSTSFAGRERRLQAMNWKVIGDARVAQGDPAGAEQAFRVAAELERE
jgi:predicted Zn-dependent protease